jgi:hypothetical protein
MAEQGFRRALPAWRDAASYRAAGYAQGRSLAQMRSAGRIEQCPGSGKKVAASAEMRWSNGWPVAATFEGEFSDVTRSHTGKRDRSGSLTAKVTRLTRNGPRPVGSVYEPGDPKTLDIG